MNKETLQNNLTKALVGKEIKSGYFAHWNIEEDILKVVQDILTSECVKTSTIAQVSVERSRYDKNDYYLKYKDHFITLILIHKSKGEYKGQYHVQQYEWFYKSFELPTECDFDFNARVIEIEQEIIKENQRKQQQSDMLYHIYKKLIQLCSKSNTQVSTIINALYKQQYSLSTRWDKDTKKDVKIVVLPKVMGDYARRLDDLHFNIDILTQDIESQKCDWENADTEEMADNTLKKLKEDGITADMVVEELWQVLDILEDIRDQTKVFQK